MSLKVNNQDFFNVVEKELNALYSPFPKLKTDLSYLKILDTDPEEIIDQKERDAKTKKKQFTPIRTSIQKLAKEKRDAFNKASKDVIALEKKFTAEILEVENFLKDVIDYRKIRAERIAEETHARRSAEIIEYNGFYNPIHFGLMTEDQWQKTLETAKLAKEAHAKQEEDRIAREKAQKEENDRLHAENLRLKQEAKEREIAEAKKANQVEPQSSAEPIGSPEQVANGSELKQLHDRISIVISQATAPVNEKELKVFDNTILLLKKTLTYLEFNK